MQIKIRIAQLLFLLYAALVAWMSLLPADDPSRLDSIDKLIHFVVYFIMALLALLAFRTNPGRIIALLITFGIGILLELGQSAVAGRVPSLADGLANLLGAAFGVLVFRLWFSWRQRRSV